MTVNKEKIAHSFAASYKTYDQHAIVQKTLAERLLTMIPQQNLQKALEIGCGTGYLAAQLVNRQKITEFYLNDISSELCSVAQQRVIENNIEHIDIHILPGDIEQLALPAQLDLVFSSSTLQWLENLEKTFRAIHKNLSHNGMFVFSIFTKGTMAEIAELTGRGLHYYQEEELKEMLEDSFTIMNIERIEDRLYFANIIALFKHIRCTGVGGVDNGKKCWTRRLMQEFEVQYRKQYGLEQGLPISYKAHCFVCKK